MERNLGNWTITTNDDLKQSGLVLHWSSSGYPMTGPCFAKILDALARLYAATGTFDQAYGMNSSWPQITLFPTKGSLFTAPSPAAGRFVDDLVAALTHPDHTDVSATSLSGAGEVPVGST